jgi:hypothetical protein
VNHLDPRPRQRDSLADANPPDEKETKRHRSLTGRDGPIPSPGMKPKSGIHQLFEMDVFQRDGPTSPAFLWLFRHVVLKQDAEQFVGSGWDDNETTHEADHKHSLKNAKQNQKHRHIAFDRRSGFYPKSFRTN